MRLRLHETVVEIAADAAPLRQACRRLLEPALLPAPTPDLHLTLASAAALPASPAGEPLFIDSAHTLPQGIGRLAVYPGPRPGRVYLYFAEGGLVDVPLADPAEPHRVRAQIHQRLVHYGRLEDLIWTALAPLLRRRGAYLVHAFGAKRDGQAVLLVGPSGSGKTTTGLLLLEQGWQLLGNDIVLLYRNRGQIWAAPMPGHVTVSRRTLSLLPNLAPLVSGVVPGVDGKWHVDSRHVYSGPLPDPAPVTAILFPAIGAGGQSVRHPESRAVALARLTEESVDRWDPSTMAGHLTLLQQMVEQAHTWRLELAPDVERIADLVGGG